MVSILKILESIVVFIIIIYVNYCSNLLNKTTECKSKLSLMELISDKFYLCIFKLIVIIPCNRYSQKFFTLSNDTNEPREISLIVCRLCALKATLEIYDRSWGKRQNCMVNVMILSFH